MQCHCRSPPEPPLRDQAFSAIEKVGGRNNEVVTVRGYLVSAVIRVDVHVRDPQISVPSSLIPFRSRMVIRASTVRSRCHRELAAVPRP
jgi:hypothetical protein